jgi:hypothetical protein
MSEKVEWEIVDDTASRRDSGARQSDATADASAARNPLQALLGPWWRWKIAGFALVAVLALVLLTLFAGAFLLAAAAGVALSLAAAKARRLFGRQRNTVAPRS